MTETDKNTKLIIEILDSDWSRAIAAKAHELLLKIAPHFLAETKSSNDIEEFNDLVKKLKTLNSDVDWEPKLNSLTVRVVNEYVKEKSSGNSIMPGGMTLYGHACNMIVVFGFTGIVASSLDGGNTENMFEAYIFTEDEIFKALSSSKSEGLPELFNKRSDFSKRLENAYESLRNKLGLDSFYGDN